MSVAAAEGLLSTPRWAMANALELMDEVEGGIERYLLRRCEVSPDVLATLREQLIEAPTM